MQAAQRCLQGHTCRPVALLAVDLARTRRSFPLGTRQQRSHKSLDQAQQQHSIHELHQCTQPWRMAPPLHAASSGGSNSSSSSDSSSSGSKPQMPLSGLNWFDRLPQRTQLIIMGALLFIGTIVIPFLQPTFLYGDGGMGGSSKPGSGQITEVQQMSQKRELPRYIPVASELYSFLHDNSMPRTLPDGRTESPGVLRIYLSSMIILAVFYACSAVVSLILRGVAGILRAVGVIGPAPPAKPEEP